MDFYYAVPSGTPVCPGEKAAVLLDIFAPGFSLPPTFTPETLPVLIDRHPCSADTATNALRQLTPLLGSQTTGILLDFQQDPTPPILDFLRSLRQVAACPLAVPPEFFQGEGFVFLPPISPDTLPAQALAPWQGTGIFLDISPSPTELCLTASGCQISPTQIPEKEGLQDTALFCHYTVSLQPGKASFTLWRTREDAAALCRQVDTLGVHACVTLWQEWNHG